MLEYLEQTITKIRTNAGEVSKPFGGLQVGFLPGLRSFTLIEKSGRFSVVHMVLTLARFVNILAGYICRRLFPTATGSGKATSHGSA